MVNQYPDSITITVKSPATQSGGVWTAGSSTNYVYDCRVESNNTGRKIISSSGNLIDYAYKCYMKNIQVIIPLGSSFVLTSLNNGAINGNVKKQNNGQFNTVLWL